MVIILFISLLLLSAFFSGSETALLSLSHLQLKKMEDKDKRSSDLIVSLLSNPRRLLLTILTGNTLVNTAASACATTVAITVFGRKGVGIAIGFMLIVLLLLGEIIPKTYAYLFSEGFSKFAAYPLSLIVRLLKPIRNVLSFVTSSMINRLGFIAPKDTSEITEDEIKSLIKIGHREGVVRDNEKEMIYGVFHFKGLSSKDIMKPKIDVMALDFDLPREKVFEYVKEAKHSRLPVYRDTMDNIIGVVYAKDVLINTDVMLKDLIRAAFFVPESQKIDSLFSDLQKRSIQMAIVTDEYGATTGVVTMEDILEEIVGEIVDEYDKEKPRIEKIDRNTYQVSGLLHINEANEKLNLKIATTGIDTIGGFVSMVLQRIPRENDEFIYRNHKFTVKKVERHRVEEIIIRKI